MTTNVLTRKDCENQLPDGTDPMIVAMHVSATAADRASSRITAAREAALSWLGSLLPCPDHSLYDGSGLLATVLAVELGGTGGRMGFGPDGGDSTARMSWAQGLGKGRRAAIDGDAWTGAIRDALSAAGGLDSVTPDSVVQLAAICSPRDIEWPLAYALRRAFAVRTSPEESAPWVDCARRVAARCEANTDAGQLASRWSLPTLADAEFGA